MGEKIAIRIQNDNGMADEINVSINNIENRV